MEVDNPLFVEENHIPGGRYPLPWLLEGGYPNIPIWISTFWHSVSPLWITFSGSFTVRPTPNPHQVPNGRSERASKKPRAGRSPWWASTGSAARSLSNRPHTVREKSLQASRVSRRTDHVKMGEDVREVGNRLGSVHTFEDDPMRPWQD